MQQFEVRPLSVIAVDVEVELWTVSELHMYTPDVNPFQRKSIPTYVNVGIVQWSLQPYKLHHKHLQLCYRKVPRQTLVLTCSLCQCSCSSSGMVLHRKGWWTVRSPLALATMWCILLVFVGGGYHLVIVPSSCNKMHSRVTSQSWRNLTVQRRRIGYAWLLLVRLAS